MPPVLEKARVFDPEKGFWKTHDRIGPMRRFPENGTANPDDVSAEIANMAVLARSVQDTSNCELPTPSQLLDLCEQGLRNGNTIRIGTYQTVGLVGIVRKRNEGEFNPWSPQGIYEVLIARRKNGVLTKTDKFAVTLLCDWIRKSVNCDVKKWMSILNTEHGVNEKLVIFDEILKPGISRMKGAGHTIAAEVSATIGLRAEAPLISEITMGIIEVEKAVMLLHTLIPLSDFSDRKKGLNIILENAHRRYLELKAKENK